MVATTIYTVGHSTRSAEELLALLREAAVARLADVRAFPSSRRHPQFNRDALAGWLGEAGIEYRHLPALGGRRSPVPGSPNGGWREAAFQGYADHMGSAEFQDALCGLEAMARESPTAIMCAEAVWWRCHRRLIADALLTRGWRAGRAPRGRIGSRAPRAHRVRRRRPGWCRDLPSGPGNAPSRPAARPLGSFPILRIVR
jgi:uncharacterized protein (DUF488 family)